MDRTLSKTFDLLRFPLAVLVVFLHVQPIAIIQIPPNVFIDGWHQFYFYLNSTISSIANAAVPCFFFISAYLIGVNISKLTPKIYFSKLKNRFYTLFIPYILWNFIAVVYMRSTGIWSFTRSLHYILFFPANYPLWFLRNLIAVTIIFPIFYWLARCSRYIIPICVFLLFCLTPSIVPHVHIWYNYFGAITVAFYFFGMYCGVHKIHFGNVTLPWRIGVWSITLIVFAIKLFSSRTISVYINNFTLVLLVASILLLTDSIVRRYNIKSIPLLASATYFVYLSHKVGPTYLSKQVFFFLPQESYLTQLVIYLVCPFITVLICVTVYYLLRRFTPRLLKILTGRS